MPMLLHDCLSVKIQDSCFPFLSFFSKNVSYISISSVHHWELTAAKGNAKKLQSFSFFETKSINKLNSHDKKTK